MAKTIKWVKGLEMPDEIDPSDVVSYTVDLDDFLGDDAITGASATGENITIDSTSYSNQELSIIVSSASPSRAKVRFTVTTATETFNRSFYINVANL